MGQFTISVDVDDLSGIKSVVARIEMLDGTDMSTVPLTDPNKDGTFTGSWNSTDASAGTYIVDFVATDIVNNTIEEDNATAFTITKLSSTISCLISKISIGIGDELIVTGSISPAPAHTGVTVTLMYTKPGKSILTRSVIVASDGTFTDTYTPDVSGSWTVKTSWAGDSSYAESTSSTKSFEVKKSGCLIATAAYESELSPQVWFLRTFRDNTVLNTFAGSNFMTIFNGFYYSFSPTVASTISDNATLRGIMKFILYPLIGILQLSSMVFSLFSFSPELGVVVAGFVASLLIAIIYAVPWVLLICFLKKIKPSLKVLRAVGVVWSGSVVSIAYAEAVTSSLLMMMSTGSFILTTLFLTTLTAVKLVVSTRAYPLLRFSTGKSSRSPRSLRD